MSIKSVLFGKVDLDTIVAALVNGVNPCKPELRTVAGSAKGSDLSDPQVLCLEVGGAGRTEENNFDHHQMNGVVKSSALQALERFEQVYLPRLKRLVQYTDEVDRGERTTPVKAGFPTLVQLIAGMLLTEKKPEVQLEEGLRICYEVLFSGIDPYGSMEKILDVLPRGREFAKAKRNHELWSRTVLDQVEWFTTPAGHKLAVVSTPWYGAPGLLYGAGADLVVALNTEFSQNGRVYLKYTVCGHKISVQPALEKLREMEPDVEDPWTSAIQGWGGPAHGTIIGSPQGKDSELSLKEVVQVVMTTIGRECELPNREDRAQVTQFSKLCQVA